MNNVEVVPHKNGVLFRRIEPGHVVAARRVRTRRLQVEILLTLQTAELEKKLKLGPREDPDVPDCSRYNGQPVYNQSLTITLAQNSTAFGYSVTIGDINGNGDLDVVIGTPG